MYSLSHIGGEGAGNELYNLSLAERGMGVMRMNQTAEQDQKEAPDQIMWEQISAYLEDMEARGCTPESIKSYRRNLTLFFRFLPPDKRMDRRSVASWRDAMLEQGYMPRTVNNRISSANGFLEYLGLREYQLPEQIRPPDGDVQPELTRNEYLRLLSAARALGKERVYFLVKVFAVTGISLHHLPNLTTEAVREGRIVLKDGRTRQIVPIPTCLRQELLDYLRRADIRVGPVFVTRSGAVLNRTSVTGSIQQLARDARVPPEKCNPRCLRKLCQATREGVEQSVSLLVEQTLDRLLEQEQLTIGWEEVNGHG